MKTIMKLIGIFLLKYTTKFELYLNYKDLGPQWLYNLGNTYKWIPCFEMRKFVTKTNDIRIYVTYLYGTGSEKTWVYRNNKWKYYTHYNH